MAVRLARDSTVRARVPVEPSARPALRQLHQPTITNNTSTTALDGKPAAPTTAASCSVVDDSPAASQPPKPSVTRARVTRQSRAALAVPKVDHAVCTDDLLTSSASSSSSSSALSSTPVKPTIEDVDRGDFDQPQLVAEYVGEIHEYLFHLQDKYQIDSTAYLKTGETTPAMRELLVSWMSEVSLEFSLQADTHFLAVAVVDQFLAKHPLARGEVQLAAIAALFLAGKYEEILHPPIDDYVYISDRTYDQEQIVAMELLILRTLDYNLSFATSLQFLRRFTKVAGFTARFHTCCQYFLEFALPQHSMLAFPPSMTAASAVYLTRHLTGSRPLWSDTLAHYTTYTEADIKYCVRNLVELLRAEARKENVGVVSDKFASKEMYRVSTSVLDYYRKN